MSDFCQLWLTCSNEEEADNIANTLLAKHLVACTKQVPISSSFRWKGDTELDKEILLVMDSRVDLFEKIEDEIAKIHSYDTFVLEAVPVMKVSKKAQDWLKEEMKYGEA